MATQLGALGVNQVRRPDFHLPPSQLVRHTEASTTPLLRSELVQPTEASLTQQCAFRFVYNARNLIRRQFVSSLSPRL